MERISVEKLARHFNVSIEQAQAAQDDIGFMYRELARAIVDPHDHSPPCGGYDDCPYPDCLVDGACASVSNGMRE